MQSVLTVQKPRTSPGADTPDTHTRNTVNRPVHAVDTTTVHLHENSSLRYQPGDRLAQRKHCHLAELKPGMRKLLTYTPVSPLTKEQDLYVRWPYLEHSTLCAPPGSGKTHSVLERIRCLVTNGLIKRNQVFFIAFSNPACAEARQRIVKYDDYESWLLPDNILTIDAIARKVLLLERNARANSVELLSLTLMNLLRGRTTDAVRNMPFIRNFRMCFIDEVQDIDIKRYTIIKNLVDKLNVKISMIGDPNQAIYGFCGGSPKYMFKFQGRYTVREFHLTRNHRSTANIVSFFKGFRSLVFHDIVATRPEGKPVKILLRTRRVLHKWLIDMLTVDHRHREEIAIICPTKGTGSVKTLGLSAIGNLLHNHHIPFVQHYSEMNSDDQVVRNRKIIPGRVNLIPYTGTKGLEFRKVIVMDFHSLLYNRVPSSIDDYWEQRNLLYVACSRARDEMIICAHQDIHPWISKIDPRTYVCDSAIPLSSTGMFPVSTPSKPTPITAIGAIVDKLNPETLDDIYGRMNIRAVETTFVATPSNATTDGSDAIVACFAKELILMQITEQAQLPRKTFPVIEALLKSNLIILNDGEYHAVKGFLYKHKDVTWTTFNAITKISPIIKTIILTTFNQQIEFSSNIISTIEAKHIIDVNRPFIRDCYDKYLSATDWIGAYDALFYLVTVIKSIETGHYYHITNGDIMSGKLQQRFVGMLYDVNDLVCRLRSPAPHSNPVVANIQSAITYAWEGLDLTGTSDLCIEGHLVEIRCDEDMHIKQYIQLLLANFCHTRTCTSTSYIINPMRGTECRIDISVSASDMFKILNSIADQCHLKFANLHIVGGLETITHDTTASTTAAEIVKLTLRELDTGLLIYNQHIRPRTHALVAQLGARINMTAEQLSAKPDIPTTQRWLAQQLRNVLGITMYMHGDDKLLQHHRLLPSAIPTTWLNTITIMRTGYSGTFTTMKVSRVYRQLFHTAPTLDLVSTVIAILKHLGITHDSKKLIGGLKL